MICPTGTRTSVYGGLPPIHVAVRLLHCTGELDNWNERPDATRAKETSSRQARASTRGGPMASPNARSPQDALQVASSTSGLIAYIVPWPVMTSWLDTSGALAEVEEKEPQRQLTPRDNHVRLIAVACRTPQAAPAQWSHPSSGACFPDSLSQSYTSRRASGMLMRRAWKDVSLMNVPEKVQSCTSANRRQNVARHSVRKLSKVIT